MSITLGAYRNDQENTKLVGSTGFGDSIITFLRPMSSNDKLESIIDSNQKLIALNDGVLFDVKNNTYRAIERKFHIKNDEHSVL